MGRKNGKVKPGAVVGLLGFFIFFIGLAGTIASFMMASAEGRGRYTVFYGAIVWGLVQIVYGFVIAIRAQNQRRSIDDDNEEDDDERLPRRPKSRQQTSTVPTPVLIGCGVAGGVLLLGLGGCMVGIYILQTLPGPEAGPGPPPPPKIEVVVAEDLGPKQAQTLIAGATNDPTFKEQAPDGGVLAGIDVGLGEAFGVELVQAIQPRFRTPNGEVMGRKFGTNFTKIVSVQAKPGYAIGAINVKSGLVVNGFSIRFMRIKGNALDPADSYSSAWIGDKTGGGGPTLLGGDGALIIGIIGRRSGIDCNGLGLLKKL